MPALPATLNDPDSELVRRTLAGDRGAFGELVERHEAVAHRVARRIVGSDEADDVTQDSFLRAFHRLERFRGDSPFRGWLLQIVHNTALNAAQRRRPEPVADSPVAEEPARERQPARELEERERRERLELKLRGLRSEHRVVLVLRDLEGLAYEEIAAVTETPLGSVKGRLHRARGELIELLRTNSYDWELPE
ncbi:MAG: RNA polymerase sigma factor [Actinomycetota bacterium]|nr:RNA polymerase sigma factor [Actinomycetota bacterium]MDQ3719292.1 RNA polymerase sigma factor [Actinomycetota bacterium]